MRRVLICAFILPLAAAGALLFDQTAASAKTVCQQTDPESGKCMIWVEGEPKPPSTGEDDAVDTGSGKACYWDPSKQGISGPPAGPVPCSSENGYWSNQYNCYVKPLDPQPPAGDPNWQGHEPGDGAVYGCYQPQTGIDVYIWSASPPPGSAAGPTPREVAQIAINQMDLRAIDIGITPEPGAGRVGLVGMPVWMWAKNPDGQTFGPATASASAGGITVTATARVHKVTWVMGDGNRVVCRTAGTPYKPSFGKKSSPDCGHVYAKSSSRAPGDKFTVTAISDWVVTWEGAGQSGTIRLNGLQRSVQIAVGEAQVLVR